MPIKNEEEDIMMLASPAMHSMSNHPYPQQIYPTLPPCSDVLQHRFFDRASSSRTRSISSSVIPPQTNQLIHPTIKNPLSVQPTGTNTMPKQTRKPLGSASHLYDRNNNHRYPFGSHINEDPLAHTSANMNSLLNLQNGLLCFDHLTNPQMFPNLSTIHYHDEKMRKTLSADEAGKYYHPDRQVNRLALTISPSSDSLDCVFFLRSMDFHRRNILNIIRIFAQIRRNLNTIIQRVSLSSLFHHLRQLL